MNGVDFLAIGDTVVDDFIKLKDASVHCKIDTDACELCMRFGDKVPFETSTVLYGVGNAANAAVSAARLGLSTAFLSNVGDDERGAQIIETLGKEGIDTEGIEKHKEVPTNYHYVLWYESERTILVHQNEYPYRFPKGLPPPKTLYFSSINEKAVQYRDDVIEYLEAHPDIFFAFQPGVFEIRSGAKAFSRFYKRANFVACNKEEAARILGVGSTDVKELLDGMLALGTNEVIITDGRHGAYAANKNGKWTIPMYPDPREPFERTGAGDAFASTVAVSMTLGKPVEEALMWGPINSMAVVQEIGAQRGLLSREKLEEYLRNAPASYRITAL